MSDASGPTGEVNRLASEHRDFLVKVAIGLGASALDAEEHADDALMGYLEARRTYGEEARARNPRGMLCVRVQYIVRNRKQKAGRQDRVAQRRIARRTVAPLARDTRHLTSSPLISAVHHWVLADYGVLSTETIAAIDAAFHELPARMQEVFTLCVVEERSAKEVGDQLGVRHDTVRRLRANAVERVRRALESKGITPWSETPRGNARRAGGDA